MALSSKSRTSGMGRCRKLKRLLVQVVNPRTSPFMTDAKPPGKSRSLRTVIVLAVALALSSLFLFVLPGYYLYLAGDMPFGHRFGPMHGDWLLPIAMQVQILWAPMLPGAFVLARRFYLKAPGRGRLAVAWILAFLMLYGWAVLLAVVFHSQAGSAST